MEDFIGAYIERRQDVEILLTNRRIVAIHLGGIVVECQLKSFLITYHKIKKWEEKSQRKKSSMFNQTISNPGHGLQKAMRQMPELFNRAKLDQKLLEHLRDIQYPLLNLDVFLINRIESPILNSCFDVLLGIIDFDIIFFLIIGINLSFL